MAVFVCLGDVASHVIIVGTCCPNLHNQPWTGSSVVKRVLIVTAKGRGFESAKKQMFFCAKLNHGSPCGVPAESLISPTRTVRGLLEKSPLYEDYTRSPSGLLVDLGESLGSPWSLEGLVLY